MKKSILIYLSIFVLLLNSFTFQSSAVEFTPQEPMMRITDAVGSQIGVALAPYYLESVNDSIMTKLKALHDLYVEGTVSMDQIIAASNGNPVSALTDFPIYIFRLYLTFGSEVLQGSYTLVQWYQIVLEKIFGSSTVDSTQLYNVPDELSEAISYTIHQKVTDEMPFFYISTTPWYSAQFSYDPTHYKLVCQAMNEFTPVYAFDRGDQGWLKISDLHYKYLVGTPSGEGYYLHYFDEDSRTLKDHRFYYTPQSFGFTGVPMFNNTSTAVPDASWVTYDPVVFSRSLILSIDGRRIKVYKDANLIGSNLPAYCTESYDPNSVAQNVTIGGKFLMNSPSYSYERIHSTIGSQTNISDSEVFIITGDYIINYIGDSHEVDPSDPSDPSDPTDPSDPSTPSFGFIGTLVRSILNGLASFFEGILKIIDSAVGYLKDVDSGLGSIFDSFIGIFERVTELFTGFSSFMAVAFSFLPAELWELIFFGINLMITLCFIRVILKFI